MIILKLINRAMIYQTIINFNDKFMPAKQLVWQTFLNKKQKINDTF